MRGHGFNSFEEKCDFSKLSGNLWFTYFPRGEQQSTVGGGGGQGLKRALSARLLVLRQLLLSYQVSSGEALKGNLSPAQNHPESR